MAELISFADALQRRNEERERRLVAVIASLGSDVLDRAMEELARNPATPLTKEGAGDE